MSTKNRPQVAAKAQTRHASSASGGWLGNFWADTSGNMSYVALAGSMVMLVFGGVGIDMMHAELKRNKVQNTLDRAVLSAADLDNDIDPNVVVQEYFAAMNMSDALASVSVEANQISRRVTATGSDSIPSDFMALIGVDELDIAGRATAENMAANMEISMVLDISGSMSGTKLQQLKDAANSFIDTVLGEGGDDSTATISLVPYNATVNLGGIAAEYFTFEDLHDASYCAEFNANQFSTTSITPTQTLGQLAHFNIQSNNRDLSWAWCTSATIVAHSNDPDLLKDHINAFTAGGNTAIDLGMKWGLALLDPAAAPAIGAMARDGVAASVAENRPAPYTDDATMKFVVVMTDGQNTSQYDLTNAKKYGMSDVYMVENDPNTLSDNRYSILVRDRSGTSNDVYYWTHNGAYRNSVYGAGAGANQQPRRLSYAELFERVNMRHYANTWYWDMYRDGYKSYNDYYNAYYSYQLEVNGNQADSRLSDVCEAGRNQDVVIFAIGVEAPSRGLQAMGDCASSPAHFFDVDGGDLDDTFASIATIITQLRLTQ